MTLWFFAPCQARAQSVDVLSCSATNDFWRAVADTWAYGRVCDFAVAHQGDWHGYNTECESVAALACTVAHEDTKAEYALHGFIKHVQSSYYPQVYPNEDKVRLVGAVYFAARPSPQDRFWRAGRPGGPLARHFVPVTADLLTTYYSSEYAAARRTMMRLLDQAIWGDGLMDLDAIEKDFWQACSQPSCARSVQPLLDYLSMIARDLDVTQKSFQRFIYVVDRLAVKMPSALELDVLVKRAEDSCWRVLAGPELVVMEQACLMALELNPRSSTIYGAMAAISAFRGQWQQFKNDWQEATRLGLPPKQVMRLKDIIGHHFALQSWGGPIYLDYINATSQ